MDSVMKLGPHPGRHGLSKRKRTIALCFSDLWKTIMPVNLGEAEGLARIDAGAFHVLLGTCSDLNSGGHRYPFSSCGLTIHRNTHDV